MFNFQKSYGQPCRLTVTTLAIIAHDELLLCAANLSHADRIGLIWRKEITMSANFHVSLWE